VAEPIQVQKLSREESVAFLKKRSGKDEPKAADELADALGDLPLALEHAAAYVDAADISTAEYLSRLRAYPKKMLAPVEATFGISFEKLRGEAPGALDWLNLVVWFAPDNIPRELWQPTLVNPLELDGWVAALRHYSLIQTGEGVISVHPLLQEVVRNGLSDAWQRGWVEIAVKLVDNAFPDPFDYRNWPGCAKLLPHALQVTEQGERLSVGLETVSRLLNQAALYENQRAQLRSAERLTRRALEIGKKVYGPDHPFVAIQASNLGQILLEEGDLAGALQYARWALEVHEKVYGPNHANVATAANGVGAILRAQGDLVGALQYTMRALKIGEKCYGPDHPDIGVWAGNVGTILQDQGDLVGALKYTQRGLAIHEKAYGPVHPGVAGGASNVGQILKELGNLAGALQYTRRALEIDEKVYGPDHPSVARDANNLGQILKAQGDLAGALQYTRRALEILQCTYGPDNPSTKIVTGNLRQIEKLLPPKKL
jgi:tetratricopeptide (TPR) repeat protein